MLRTLRRRLRGLLQRLRPPKARFVYDRRYEHQVSGLPVDPLRADRILTFLSLEGLLSRGELCRPKPVSMEAIRMAHTDRYLESLQDAGTLASIVGLPATGFELEGLLNLQRRMVGGTLEAMDQALAHGCVGVNLGGGFHHAKSDKGGGFCVFNDIAIAIRHLRSTGFTANILVVDCDLHDGDGTRTIFASDPTVHTFSVHNQTLDDQPAIASTSIALGTGVQDAAYLEALRQALPPVLQEVQPGLIFYLAGADPADGDAIGDWHISLNGLLERDRFVLGLARDRSPDIPVVLLLAGGYGPQAWRCSARTFADLLGGQVLEPPDNDDLMLARFRQMAKLLDPAELTGLNQSQAPEDWSLTAQELEGSMCVHPQNDRLLDYYSAHGVELALERYGLLNQIRALGYKEPTISIALDAPSGHRVRLYGDARKTELLLELVLSRDRRIIPGMELLLVGWLLLQNPRARFAEDRPRLPGQEHPGLGLLQEVLGVLMMVCERLGLEGLVYLPAHFHTAYFSGAKGLRFLKAEDEARYQAIRQAAGDMNLAEISWALEQGRLLDPETGQPFRWRGEPMILPVTERLKKRLLSGAPAEGNESNEEGDLQPV